MRDVLILFLHLIATVARLAGPGGLGSVVAESLLVKHQLRILNRGRKRAPNLRTTERFIAGVHGNRARRMRTMKSAGLCKIGMAIVALTSRGVARWFRWSLSVADPFERFRIWIEPHNGDFWMNALDHLNQSARPAADVENTIAGAQIRLLEERSPRGIGSEQLHKRIVERQGPVVAGRGKIRSSNFLHGLTPLDQSLPY